MSNYQSEKLKLKIRGMHCASCELLIEHRFKKIPGVEKVKVSHASGQAEVWCKAAPTLSKLKNAVKDAGYKVSLWDDDATTGGAASHNTRKDYFEIGSVFLIIVALYLILQQFDLLPNLGVSDNMSYGFVFLIGVVAAFATCLAVTGGLLLAVAAKYNERFPNVSSFQKFKPTFYFNVGRIVSYTVLGSMVGALGSVLSLSSRATGFMSIAASLVMIIIGFQLLKLFPWMRRFQPRMPKFLGHKIHDMSGKGSKSAPFFLGASTFFLPCGFTQALQLYILAKGDMTTGALTMLAFSLGTLPALISLSAISSFVKGAFQRHFLQFSGVLVIMLGVFNINNGLALTGSNFSLASVFAVSNVAQANIKDDNVKVVDGKQIVEMKVDGLGYYPSQFTVVQGVPVEWRIDASRAEGCGQVVTVPKLGIFKYLSPTKITVITFTPEETGPITFSCTMGMTTSGAAFNVVPNTKGVVAATNEAIKPVENGAVKPAENAAAQKLSTEFSQERGFYPNAFTIRKNIPVEMNIDVKVPPGGCMSVMVVPEYDTTTPLKVGINKLAFTPTKTGTIDATCSMGTPMIQFKVVE